MANVARVSRDGMELTNIVRLWYDALQLNGWSRMTRKERAYMQMCIFDRGSSECKELEEEVPCMS